MRKSNKKGFTVVELVIVIAIIAILAAVLIPTFASLIQKANESKDTQLVKNLNTALAADNKKHPTMQSALDAAAEFGYDVGKINASATGNEILWDSKNDVFCYLKNGNVEYIPETNLKNGAVAANETYKLWKIYTSESKVTEDVNAGKTYSIYWNSSDAYTKELKTGFDAGNCKANMTLKYVGGTSEQSVVILTNGGKLIIDAENDTVNHYGEVENVDIKAVDLNHSYHEYGKAGYVEIAKGHIVVEEQAKVIALVSTGANTEIKVDAKETAEIVTAITTNESAQNDSHGGNVQLTYQVLTEEEKAEIIYNAEAQMINAISVNGKYFKTIGDAFIKGPKANGDGYDLSGNNTIVLLKDIEDSALLLPDNNNGGNVVIDFNGYTYTVNSSVGSTGTATQAMHFGKAKNGKTASVTLKNGTLTTKAGITDIYMAMQNYVEFKAENMTFDLSNIPVEYYGENEFTGQYEKFNGHELSTFNNNSSKQMVLENCTVIFPDEANYCISVGCSLKLINTKITGAVSLSVEEELLVDSTSSISKGVVPYFDDEGSVVNNTTDNPGFTTYKLQ